MRSLTRIITIFFSLIFLGVFLFFFGPKVEKPNLDKTLPMVSSSFYQLEKDISLKESKLSIKPHNESRIIWYDSIRSKTTYSLVYLHGWSASSEEGAPLHMDIARKYGFNLYLPRLAGHGLNEKEPMLNLTANDVIASAKEAIAIAKKIGDKVIVMATSTGATLALHLAGGDKDIAGLLLFSPNIAISDKNASLLSGPWGLQLARFVKQGNYHEFKANELRRQFWTTKYRIEALPHLQALIDYTMNKETFKQVTQPTFVGYFYKNEQVQDKVISIPAVLKMYEELGTVPAHFQK